jgi:hypothetical protein
MASLGLTGAAIPGTKYGVRRLVDGLARDLFLEDSAIYYQDLLGYEVPELESLESAVTWLDRFLSDTINPKKLIDQLDPAVLTKGLHGKRASRQPDDKPATAATTSPQRVRAKRTVAYAWPKSTGERAETNKHTKAKTSRQRAKYGPSE